MKTSNETQNQGETNGQTDAIFHANETLLMTNINRTVPSNQAQKQDDTNGHTDAFSSANVTVTTP